MALACKIQGRYPPPRTCVAVCMCILQHMPLSCVLSDNPCFFARMPAFSKVAGGLSKMDASRVPIGGSLGQGFVFHGVPKWCPGIPEGPEGPPLGSPPWASPKPQGCGTWSMRTISLRAIRCTGVDCIHKVHWAKASCDAMPSICVNCFHNKLKNEEIVSHAQNGNSMVLRGGSSSCNSFEMI